jgi:acetate kinase
VSPILVINSGSSSIKYQLIDAGSGDRRASGLIERIGEPLGRIVHQVGEIRTERELVISDHRAGFSAMIEAFAAGGLPLQQAGLAAVGHRVVQGGS